MKQYRPWQPNQSFLFPVSPMDWLPEGHLAFFILDVVGELDLSEFEEAIQSADPRGERPYSPRMMVALLLYGYAIGVYSSRKIARKTYEDVAFRVLAGGNHPHFTRICAFRRAHEAAFRDLFVKVLELCAAAGLVKLGCIAIDGSKVQGNASKHKAMSYERMEREEDRLTCEISDLLELAEQIDANEDEQGGDGPAFDLPAELTRREDRLRRIRETKAALEVEAAQSRIGHLRELAQQNRAKAEETGDPGAETRSQRQEAQAQQLEASLTNEPDSVGCCGAGNPTEQGLRTHRVPCTPDGRPKSKAQRNFTDPDSRIMERDSTFLQGFNCQVAVDEAAQVIVAQAVTNLAPDTEHLGPMLRQVVDNCGAAPDVATADAGYWRADHETFANRLGTDLYVMLQRKHRPPDEALANRENQTPRVAMARKLDSARGRRFYARRKAIVEPVFGQIREVRGFRRFSLRGLSAVISEWSIVTTAHNLLKLFRYGPSAGTAAA